MNRQRASGQAMVEFSLAILIFLVLLMGVVDFGMSVYKYNGVSEAAREIARVASVHQNSVGTFFGTSPQIAAVVATQQNLVPGLSAPTFTCTDVNGATVPLDGFKCPPTAYATVVVMAPYKPATPVLGILGTFTMKGSSSVQIQQ